VVFEGTKSIFFTRLENVELRTDPPFDLFSEEWAWWMSFPDECGDMDMFGTRKLILMLSPKAPSDEEILEGLRDSQWQTTPTILRPISSNTASSHNRHSISNSSRFKLRVPSRTSITDDSSVVTSPLTPIQPQSFYGIINTKMEEQLEKVEATIKDIPFHIELVDAPVYVENEILPRLLAGIETLLRLVKKGAPPKDPIRYLAQVLIILIDFKTNLPIPFGCGCCSGREIRKPK
jgi:hypothetical protein